jgi:OmcA/MtrC family decaheme c-type cytochrome
VPIDSAERINIAITGVSVPAGGDAPTVSLSLTNDLELGLKGLPAGDIRFVLSQLSPGTDGGSSEWQSYVTRDTGDIANGQATTETATAGSFVDNGDGTYEYTFAQALTAYPAGPVFDATKTHRLGVEIREQAPISTNGIYDFLPAGGAPLFERKIVDNDTCNACHDRLEFHGGPRTDVEYCVTCHNPYSTDGDTGNTVDMKALIHNIHSGRDGYVIEGYRGRVYDFSDTVWTQDPRNCQTCHEENDADTPQASNWRLVQNRASCGTCHFDAPAISTMASPTTSSTITPSRMAYIRSARTSRTTRCARIATARTRRSRACRWPMRTLFPRMRPPRRLNTRSSASWTPVRANSRPRPSAC